MSEFVILIPPAIDAVSLEEIRAYLRVGSDADNATLAIIQSAAIASIECRSKMALIERKVRQSFTNRDIANAIALANKVGGAPLLRPAFAPHTIAETRAISANGIVEVSNNIVAIESGKFRLNGYAFSIEVEYFAGSQSPNQIPEIMKLAVLEEVARLIAVRDNEKTQSQNHEVRL